MILEAGELTRRVREQLVLDGTTAVVTDVELSRLAGRYALCVGMQRWDVREYSGRAPGSREYRVVRGDRIEDVFVSPLRATALAVGVALNTLEGGDA